jgi:uncharacterized protein (TIGR03435 family)
MKTLLKAGVLLCLLFFNVSSFSQIVAKAAPKIGSTPPPLQFSQMVQGPNLNEISWDKLKGKIVVLEFWQTTCAPCIEAIPHLNELVEQFSNRVVFISISDDNGDYLKKFLKRKPIKSWVVLDGLLSPTRTAFDVHGFPHTVIVDASGKIAAITFPGELQAKHLEEIMAGKPCSLPSPQLHSPDDRNAVAVTNLAPTKVEITNPAPTKVGISIKGPFPKPDRGPFRRHGWNWSKSFPDFEAGKASLEDIIPAFFDISPKLVFGKNKLPEGLYDISAIAPPDNLPELKRQFADKLKTTFGIAIQAKKQNVKAYVMTVCSTNAPGIKQVQRRGGGGQRPGGFYLTGTKMDKIASFMELSLDKPIINETGLAGLWSVNVKWPMTESELNSDSTPDPDKVIKAVREQLGLELTSTNRTLDVLEITRSKN